MTTLQINGFTIQLQTQYVLPHHHSISYELSVTKPDGDIVSVNGFIPIIGRCSTDEYKSNDEILQNELPVALKKHINAPIEQLNNLVFDITHSKFVEEYVKHIKNLLYILSSTDILETIRNDKRLHKTILEVCEKSIDTMMCCSQIVAMMTKVISLSNMENKITEKDMNISYHIMKLNTLIRKIDESKYLLEKCKHVQEVLEFCCQDGLPMIRYYDILNEQLRINFYEFNRDTIVYEEIIQAFKDLLPILSIDPVAAEISTSDNEINYDTANYHC